MNAEPLLNKVAKLGMVARLRGACIHLQSRPSSRVPFGTGPAVRAIAAAAHPGAAPVFYHPHCYETLRSLLGSLPELAARPERDLPGLTLERSLAKLRANEGHLPFGEADFGHIFLSHRHRVRQFLIFVRFFPHVDQRSLPGRARRVEDKSFRGHKLGRCGDGFLIR